MSSVMNAGILIESSGKTIGRRPPATHPSEVRVIPLAEYKEAAASLAESFQDDRVIRYPIDTPDRMHWSEEERYALHRQALEYITYAHCLKGLALTVGEKYGSVALWMPPGKNMDDWLTILRSGMWRLSYQLSAEGKKRFFDEFLPLLHAAKDDVMGTRDSESWYLVYIGTREASRGKGYARKLIEHVTKQEADREGRACYLESSNDINPIIYGKLGFKTIKNIYLKREKEEIRLDCMLREPAVAAEPLNAGGLKR